jgi:hypothetical protein
MHVFSKRWRERQAMMRRERAISRAIEAANSPTVAAELRAIAATQFNR